MSKESKSAKRQASHRRAEERHARLGAEQQSQHQANQDLRRRGELTLWEKACALRSAARMHLHEIWAKEHPTLAAEQRNA